MSQLSQVRKNLANNIRWLRQLRRDHRGRPCSMQRLSALTGVAYGTIQKIETQVTWPDWGTLEKLACGLGVHIDLLFLDYNIVRGSVSLDQNRLRSPQANFDLDFFRSKVNPLIESLSQSSVDSDLTNFALGKTSDVK